MVTNVGFEGLTPPNVFSPTISNPYDGLTWSNVGTVGYKYLNAHYNNDGFHHVIHQKIVGDAHGFSPTGPVMAEFDDAIVGDNATFSLKSGIFASAFDTGETVTFEALDGSTVVGTKVVVMDQTAHTINFGAKFEHITGVRIVSDGGTDANPNDGGTGSQIAMDNLRVVFDPLPGAMHEHPPMTAHDFGVAHSAADWGWQ